MNQCDMLFNELYQCELEEGHEGDHVTHGIRAEFIWSTERTSTDSEVKK